METKTTKAKLLSIWGQGGCTEFNKVIKEILIEQVVTPETTEFVVGERYLKRIPECNSTQLKLLKDIGIEPVKTKWSRTMEIGTNNFSYLVGGGVKTPISVESTVRGKSDAYATGCYPTAELAKREAKIITLMILMRNWARFHNELDGFKSDWDKANQEKYGILLYGSNICTNGRFGDNELLFGISVKTIHRAEEMLQEFREEIKEIIPFL